MIKKTYNEDTTKKCIWKRS